LFHRRGCRRRRRAGLPTETAGCRSGSGAHEPLVQLSDELLARLDSYRAREGRSRSEVVREAIERYLADDREAEIDRLIVEAYARQPPEELWNEQAAKQMIAAEPW
jgi:predicted DNA-binding protein